VRECLDENAIAALTESGLASASAEHTRHLDECDRCRSLLGGALALSGPSGTGPLALAPGARLGRYLVGELIGGGAMGLVYAAQDLELGRRAALKLLRTDDEADAAQLGARLRIEAQALARIAHPNVVTVYEVGEFDGRVFLAMELVEGQTVAAWLRAEPRTWREVLAAFRQAAQGLAATHEVGLVHRDFKPDNVIVGRDGRVRVSDFGLARAEGALAERRASARATPAYRAVA
jgi:serine/threonine protein kinase